MWKRSSNWTPPSTIQRSVLPQGGAGTSGNRGHWGEVPLRQVNAYSSNNKDEPAHQPDTTGRKFPKLRHILWAASSLAKGRRKRKPQYYDDDEEMSMIRYHNNTNQRTLSTPDASIFQASRDGRLDKVKEILRGSGTVIGMVHDLQMTNDSFSMLLECDDDGYTALHHAARYNRDAVLSLFLDIDAGMNSQGQRLIDSRNERDGTTPLHIACKYNDGGAGIQVIMQAVPLVNAKDHRGQTPLHYATSRGNDTSIKMLMCNTQCDVNTSDNDRTTPLILACTQGNLSICELLLSRKADHKALDINEMTPLMWASCEGHLEICKLLLRTAGKNENIKAEKNYIRLRDNEGNTALFLAVQNGNFEVCELLLDRCQDKFDFKKNYVDMNRNDGSTPLHLASSNGYYKIGTLLLERGANINKSDNELMTATHKAALNNKVEILQLLYQNGSDSNIQDKRGMTPLHAAAWKGQTKAIDFLLNHGSRITDLDNNNKTALHWAVQFAHSTTLEALLKNLPKDSKLIEGRSRNDQTILHYAAYTGNMTVMNMLLELGACTDARDTDEKCPLHIAAQYNNVECVQALVHKSNRETNDDNIEGMTPLLTACLSGNDQVVQVLLKLNADVSKTDNANCTALMLASREGHTQVMRTLIDNHADINAQDKMKNTALHFSCSHGHLEAVTLLLNSRADVTIKNTLDHAPLDLAIDNLHAEVTNTMLVHKSWKNMLSVHDKNGYTAMDRLIEKLPDAAFLVLDHCVERSTRDEKDPDLKMIFDYQYIDPGPTDTSYDNKKRYYALNTMVQHHRENLLSHPLCQSLLSQKWLRFGRMIFALNLILYLGYLLSLTYYVLNVDDPIRVKLIDDTSSRCPIVFTDEEISRGLDKNATITAYYKQYGKMTLSDRQITNKTVLVFNYILFGFAVIFIIRELSKFIHQKRHYLSFINLIPWIMITATFVLILPFATKPCLIQWRGAWISLLLAWINFIMYLRRLDFLGIFVIMFVAVLTSLLKAVFMFLFFILAFTGSFYIVLSTRPIFKNLWAAFINIFVMTLGEVSMTDETLSSLDAKNHFKFADEPFFIDYNFLVLLFLFIMPIVLMNLMIGIAVGDIEKIQHNAYLKRIALQVDLLYMLESNLPRYLQHKFHVRKITLRPNDHSTDNFITGCWRRTFGSTSHKLQFIQAERKDHISGSIERLKVQINNQHRRMRDMQSQMTKQMNLLEQIGQKLDIKLPSVSNTVNISETLGIYGLRQFKSIVP